LITGCRPIEATDDKGQWGAPIYPDKFSSIKGSNFSLELLKLEPKRMHADFFDYI